MKTIKTIKSTKVKKSFYKRFKIRMKYSNKLLKNRWKSDSPKFWKSILKYSTILGSIAFGILTMDGIVGLSQYINPVILQLSGYILTACGAMGLSAKLTKK